jgi:hypothetical protein
LFDAYVINARLRFVLIDVEVKRFGCPTSVVPV